MNFINPYTCFYFSSNELRLACNIPYHKEVIWLFLKHVDNKLKMFKHRVNINLSEVDEVVKTRRFGSIYDYYTKIDIKEFSSLNELSKRKFLLQIIYEAFKELAECHHWDKELIHSAYEKARKEDYNFHSETIPKTNKSKSAKATIQYFLEGNTLSFYTYIIDHLTGEHKKEVLLKTDEDNFSWWRRIKGYGWYDNEKFGLKFLNGELWIVNNLATGEIQEIINLKENSMKDIERLLADLKAPPYAI